MLVLSRKPGERIRIGDNVTVTIVRIGPNNVRLGIDAPKELNIVREELCIETPACAGSDGLNRENAASNATGPSAPSPLG